MRDAAGELADRLHFLRLPQSLLGGLALGGFAAQIRERQAELGRAFGHASFQLLVQLLQGCLGEHAVGDVAALREDAQHGAVIAEEGLIDEVEEALFERRAGLALQARPHAAADERLPVAKDPVEDLEKSLSLDFRKRVAHRLSDQIAMADELQIGFVDEVENVGPARPGGT